jgi:hypothetical protein
MWEGGMLFRMFYMLTAKAAENFHNFSQTIVVEKEANGRKKI